jgi:hypothetical protein
LNWGLLARKQSDRKTERERLAAALDIFAELNMPREREEARAELEKTAVDDKGIWKLRKKPSVTISRSPDLFCRHHGAFLPNQAVNKAQFFGRAAGNPSTVIGFRL